MNQVTVTPEDLEVIKIRHRVVAATVDRLYPVLDHSNRTRLLSWAAQFGVVIEDYSAAARSIAEGRL